MFRYASSLLLLVALVLSGCTASRSGQRLAVGDQAPQLMAREVVHTYTLPYLLYLPSDYEERESWPLLLFLHGAGERGSDLEKLKVHGPPKLIAAGQDFPMIIVSPQCPARSWWDVDSLSALLDEIEEKYHVDTSRVYLSGLSMGGFGTWALASAQPERFAAIAPICGGGEPIMARFRLSSVPAWVFHGAKDPVVPPRRSEEMVEALRRARGEVKSTVYPEADHDSWTETYNNPQLYEWLLAHQKPRESAPTPRR